jgi:hypothetical protein
LITAVPVCSQNCQMHDCAAMMSSCKVPWVPYRAVLPAGEKHAACSSRRVESSILFTYKVIVMRWSDTKTACETLGPEKLLTGLPGLEVLLGSQTAPMDITMMTQSNHMASMLQASCLATVHDVCTLQLRPRKDGILKRLGLGLRTASGNPGTASIKILGTPPISCMRTYPRGQHPRAPAQCACLRSNVQRSKVSHL